MARRHLPAWLLGASTPGRSEGTQDGEVKEKLS
jgi:hypothetical protein